MKRLRRKECLEVEVEVEVEGVAEEEAEEEEEVVEGEEVKEGVGEVVLDLGAETAWEKRIETEELRGRGQ